jgi:hypothetical protein
MGDLAMTKEFPRESTEETDDLEETEAEPLAEPLLLRLTAWP